LVAQYGDLLCLIEIDGSQKSGSGTILRISIALAAILRQPLHIYNIRQNRPKPGLKPQHLQAVLTAAELCKATLKGARINSRELWFEPNQIEGGRIEAEIGTAGSIPMLLMTVLPICAFAKNIVDLHVTKGGTDVSHAPTVNYLRFVLLPVLQRMGLTATVNVRKYGYYPKGNGEVTANVQPVKSLKPLTLETFGNIKTVKGVSVCTFLADRKVAERQAKTAKDYLAKVGCTADIQVVNDASNPMQKGSSIVLWAETDYGAILGADAVGELGKSSEAVGREAAERLWKEISTGATVDIHLADQLIPYIALAPGRSVFTTHALADHLETNIWLLQKMLNIRFGIKRLNGLYKIEKAGNYQP
jgi:RNA 3'-terminal phosphate cyclase (ATP)